MKIAIATKNNGKLKEFEELAKGTPYESVSYTHLTLPTSVPV